MTATIHAHDVIPLTGERTFQYTVKLADLIDNIEITEAFLRDVDDWFMVLSLPKAIGRFVRLFPAGPHKGGADARRYVGDVLKVPAAALTVNDFYVVMLSKNKDLNMGVRVDTDKAACLEQIEEHRKQHNRQSVAAGMTVTINVDIFAMDPEQKRVVTSRNELTLMLTPITPMETFDGYSAIDFGNTSTTLARSRVNEDSFAVIQADIREPLAEPGKPVQTALRIGAITPAESADGFHQYRCGIGERWITNVGTDWLVLGAKRLLSDRKRGAADTGCTVVLKNTVYTIPIEDPAELFISEMLRGFFFHEQAIPEPIVVTCPTTFTVSEVARLRRTVARAAHRATGQPASSFRRSLIEQRVPLVVDEASAAAFYFAYVDFIAGPGRMPAFRYLYPNGMHMLLYDCGGGTTDMSLVRLESPEEGQLRVSVLGRAGHRTFGGDFITLQVYRLLKLKLAIWKGFPEEVPSPAKLPEFLREHEPVVESQYVQTQYDVRQMQNDAAQHRAGTAMAIWQVAERLKVLLSREGVTSVAPDEIENAEILKKFKQQTGFDPEVDSEQLRILRREVDALIDPEIDRTIEYANDLVTSGLGSVMKATAGRTGDSLELPEVHWVYIVGNAARYPRVRERLLDAEKGLKIRFLKDRVAEVRSEDFKNSVAKGAIVAMKLQRMAMGMTVSWDQDLVNRLSFDIVHETLGKAGDQVLFETGERYTSQLRRTLEIPPDPVTKKAITREIVLSRRWPGEARAEKHLIFRFREAIVGPYAVAYDDDLQAFIAFPDRQGGEDERVVAEPFEVVPYVAPPQSGKI